jgi:hypothetical protein
MNCAILTGFVAILIEHERTRNVEHPDVMTELIARALCFDPSCGRGLSFVLEALLR